METKTRAKTFVEEVSSIPGGEGVRLCIQCGTCTASCPSATRWEYTPSGVIAMIRAGMRHEVLSSSAMWHCLSCYSCTVRCPRNVKPTALFHILESMASREGLSSKQISTPAMYRAFNYFVASQGRLPEFWFMLRFYLSTNPLRPLGMLPVAMSLLSHGRLSLKSGRLTPAGTKQLKAILNKAQSLGGAL